ncbi:hypothetical protein SAMN04488074_101906 [Lentzea albidocapillata subsp. violacea]|uniref:Uncharacterized protein n=1 Tax=Lentzea albidocapillata subsp. violacea TaxID=128104 RepID=A0A1G8S8K9_9PSEU|nr:hypothetical protein [Lentzea albidocapillata]SDJ25536.1 hypothetical protein SAMN04488074_101906 [Lentzea albidocapillata subsp. violacea]
MTELVVALLTPAVLASATMWCSLRVIVVVDLDFLPAGCRRRIEWWQAHAGYLYLACVVLAIVAIAHQITS